MNGWYDVSAPGVDGTGVKMYVYRSANEVADVPFGVTTVTLTVPNACGGADAMICVFETTVNDGELRIPKYTTVVPLKLVPVIVTGIAYAVGPLLGLTEVTVTYMPDPAPPVTSSDVASWDVTNILRYRGIGARVIYCECPSHGNYVKR